MSLPASAHSAPPLSARLLKNTTRRKVAVQPAPTQMPAPHAVSAWPSAMVRSRTSSRCGGTALNASAWWVSWPLISKLADPGPWSSRPAVTVGSGEPRAMVAGRARENSIRSAPDPAGHSSTARSPLAASIASRSEQLPSAATVSAVVVTAMVAASGGVSPASMASATASAVAA